MDNQSFCHGLWFIYFLNYYELKINHFLLKKRGKLNCLKYPHLSEAGNDGGLYYCPRLMVRLWSSKTKAIRSSHLTFSRPDSGTLAEGSKKTTVGIQGDWSPGQIFLYFLIVLSWITLIFYFIMKPTPCQFCHYIKIFIFMN